MKALLAIFLATAGAHAQLTTADPAVQSACARVVATHLPAGMEGPPPAAYPKCDSYSFYEKKDYPAARACAIQERLALLARLPGSPSITQPADSANDGGDPAGGLVVLSQLFANGEGVQRDPALAARFFCEAIDTNEVEHDPNPTSTKMILDTIERIQAITSAAPRFDLCVTSGSSFPSNTTSSPPEDTPETRYCMRKSEQEWESQYPAIHAGGIEEAYNDAQKDADDAAVALQPALRKLTPVQRAAYNRLKAAFAGFIAKQVTGDALDCPPYSTCDVPGPGELAKNEEAAALDTQLAALLKAPPPIPEPAQVNAADAELNQVYRDLITAAAGVPQRAGPVQQVNPEMLRVEQRAWLAYRDAFVSFGKTLYPNLPSTAWLLPFTAARTADLHQIYDIAGADWIAKAKEHQQFVAAALESNAAEAASRRAQVSQYFDHQTPVQAAAWQRVQLALADFVTAHNAAVPNPYPAEQAKRLQDLYGELYAFQYNAQHFPQSDSAEDRAKIEQGFAANERRLNDAYKADLASACLFKPLPQNSPTIHRTPEGLRAEQHAWLKLRDAWVDFLATLFPEQPRAALANMFTGGRAFELRMLTESCNRN
jgi:uncharacterized protein YecT (DUF1311 family)